MIFYFSSGAAITPRHIICTEHIGQNVGDHLTWIAADGTLVTRTVIDVRAFVGTTYPNSPSQLDSFRIGYLNADLPVPITKYAIMADRFTPLANLPAITLHHLPHEAAVANISWAIADSTGFARPTNYPTRLLYYQDAISGDSSAPCFVVSADGSLVYVTSLVFGGPGSGGSGPSVSGRIWQIMTACRELDEGNADLGYRPTLLVFHAHAPLAS